MHITTTPVCPTRFVTNQTKLTTIFMYASKLCKNPFRKTWVSWNWDKLSVCLLKLGLFHLGKCSDRFRTNLFKNRGNLQPWILMIIIVIRNTHVMMTLACRKLWVGLHIVVISIPRPIKLGARFMESPRMFIHPAVVCLHFYFRSIYWNFLHIAHRPLNP